MKEIPTPLTDAHDRMAKDCPPLIWVVSQAFARQLEQDRAELLSALEYLEQAYSNRHSPTHRALALNDARALLERMK